MESVPFKKISTLSSRTTYSYIVIEISGAQRIKVMEFILYKRRASMWIFLSCDRCWTCAVNKSNGMNSMGTPASEGDDMCIAEATWTVTDYCVRLCWRFLWNEILYSCAEVAVRHSERIKGMESIPFKRKTRKSRIPTAKECLRQWSHCIG